MDIKSHTLDIFIDLIGHLVVGLVLNIDLVLVLGFKDLGTNVFRTLMCIVGKPWSKQVV